ncbi:MAG: DNA alkylation repair protein [Marinilabiliaceae bacterium]|nr:DNA alkylation repair protein [Marinilabiliaceae bacterium]
MKFFIDNQEVDRQVDNVMKKLRLHMNGETSHQMSQRGIIYRTNYGVGIPHLKEIAAQLPVSYALAERLWYREIRETMILAAMIVPHQQMTIEKCQDWVRMVTNMDLVERTTPFLFGKLEAAPALAKIWLDSDEPWLVHLGCYTLGWSVYYAQTCTSHQMDDFVNLILMWKNDTLAEYAKSISFVIRKFIRLTKKSSKMLDQFIEKLSESDLKQLLITVEEIRTELEFVRD